MKSTDIIQPAAMATPIAISGSKDTIPQEQADVEYPWYCSIEEGFPDITMKAKKQGGRPPRGQGMNGLLNLISDQKVYLQNGGILTFNQNVSDTIGGYPQGAILDYVNDDTYAKVISLVNDNTVNFLIEGIDNTNWKLLDFGGGSSEEGANTDLSNLTSTGNAKFQYAPFAINNGVVDGNGQNATLSTSGGVPVSIDTYIIPALSANTSSYGTCNDYTMTNTKSLSWTNFTNPWTMTLANDNYIPSGATVTFTISTNNSNSHQGGSSYIYVGCQGCKITYTYTDDTSEVIFDENDTGNFSTWTGNAGKKTATITLSVVNKTIKAISVQGYPNNGGTYNAWGITFKAQYNVSSSNTLIVNPCTITTADGKTKTFMADNILDCSSVANGTYYVMKSYTDGSLTLANTINVSKTQPVSPASGDLWLDSSQYPLSLKKYNNGAFTTNNDIVSLGTITVANGLITTIKNNYFNACPAMHYVVETYKNGASWYKLWSDGWCEQGGITGTGSSTQTINLLKTMRDTNYYINLTQYYYTNDTDGTTYGIAVSNYPANVTTGGFTVTLDTHYYCGWEVKGYVNS